MNLKDFLSSVKTLDKNVRKKYIYGAGLYASNLYKILADEGIKIDGFVTTGKPDRDLFLSLPVVKFSEINISSIGLILGMNNKNVMEVKKYLREMNFPQDNIVDGNEVIDGDSKRYTDVPKIEITTLIGCRINCRYCPQSVLQRSYFLGDKKRERIMTLDTFRRVLDNCPEKCVISFCGFSEPFLNKDAIDMIEMTVDSGRDIQLSTTLEGLTLNGFNKIKDVPFSFVALHVADKYGYANVTTNDSYFELLEQVVNYRRADGNPFITLCNAQAEPNERVAKICNGKYIINTALHDRAGNLSGDGLISGENPCGRIHCSLGEKLNNNVLLPDGTLILCSFDFGLKHVLGNLKYQKLSEIRNGEEMKKIFSGMSGDTSVELLCRKCSSSYKVE